MNLEFRTILRILQLLFSSDLWIGSVVEQMRAPPRSLDYRDYLLPIVLKIHSTTAHILLLGIYSQQTTLDTAERVVLTGR